MNVILNTVILMLLAFSGGSAKSTRNVFAECASSCAGAGTRNWGRRACWVAAAPASMGFNATAACGGGGGCAVDPVLGPGAVGACNWTLGLPKPLLP